MPNAYQMLRQAMIRPLSEDQVELIVAAVMGALFGILTGYSLENGWFGTIIWALIGAVVVSGAIYCLRVLR
jgi:F0F1-type ATP synthase assembly protein I